jgi:hypothetical protein
LGKVGGLFSLTAGIGLEEKLVASPIHESPDLIIGPLLCFRERTYSRRKEA